MAELAIREYGPPQRAPSQEPPPDEKYLMNLIEQAKRDFEARDARDLKRDELYWGENPIPHPDRADFEAVHMMVAAETVGRLKGIMDDYPTVSVSTTSVVDRAVRRTTKVEDFVNHMFPALEDDADADTWDNTLEDIIRLSRGFDELLYVPQWRSNLAPDYPHRRVGETDRDWLEREAQWQIHGKLPILWRNLPARNVFMWRDEWGVAEALVIEPRRVKDLLNRYGGLKNVGEQVERGNLSLFSPVYHVRYYSRAWCAYWVSDHAIPDSVSAARQMDTQPLSQLWLPGNFEQRRRETQGARGVDMLRMMSGSIAYVHPNPYGCIPITETSGLTSSDRSSGRRQLSILDHMLPIAQYLDALISQKASAVRVWAWPTPYVKQLGVRGQGVPPQQLGEDGRPIPFEIEPGKVAQLLPGEELGWIIAPENGAGADELIGIIQRQADLLGISSAVFTADTTSGYLYNSILNAVRSKYNPILRHVRRSHRQRVQLLLRILELHDGPLYVQKPGDGEEQAGKWLALSGDDVKGTYYSITTKFEDHLPIDEAANMGLARQATEGEHPLMDDNKAREKYLGDESPERTEERVLIQKYRRHPVVEERLIAYAAEKAGMLIEEEERGTPETALAGMTPEEIAALPPALLAQLQGAGGPVMESGAPSAGGLAGAAAEPFQPGVNRSLTPPPPSEARRRPMRTDDGRLQGGRAAGQSRRPPRPSPPAGV